MKCQNPLSVGLGKLSPYFRAALIEYNFSILVTSALNQLISKPENNVSLSIEKSRSYARQLAECVPPHDFLISFFAFPHTP